MLDRENNILYFLVFYAICLNFSVIKNLFDYSVRIVGFSSLSKRRGSLIDFITNNNLLSENIIMFK